MPLIQHSAPPAKNPRRVQAPTLRNNTSNQPLFCSGVACLRRFFLLHPLRIERSPKRKTPAVHSCTRQCLIYDILQEVLMPLEALT